MLLRRFEAYGFKSFADKVELEFGSGVTAIVGPNGSGKSNISDAIRWVLGEQNVRNLRGAKTEDIIFAGSSERRPLNVAEVSLIFDNSDNRIPLDFNEVIITRRVYRSGESEYLINKTACRLKDIHEILTDIGLGRESMAVISQSKVDEVLNSRPEERRLLFEDAAGITKYRLRKRDALRKLEDTETNLVRVADIMAELESQLGPMAESAARTEQYNQYLAELTACQVSLLLNKLDRAQSMLGDISQEQVAINDQFAAESAQLATSEAAGEQLTQALSGLEQQLQAEGEAAATTAAELEKTDNRIAVLRERSEQKRLAAERVEQDVAQLSDKLGRATQEQTDAEEQLQLKRRQAAAAAAAVRQAEELLTAALAHIAEKEEKIVTANDAVFAGLQELSGQRNLRVNLERDLSRLQSRCQQLASEEQEFAAKLLTAEEESRRLTAEQADRAASQEELQRETESQLERRKQAAAQSGAVRSELADTAAAIGERQSRLSALLHMQRDLEGFNRGSKAVLNSREPWKSGVCGAVAQLIEVPSAYLTAIEIALGGAMQDIVTEDEATVRAAIASLKRQNAGRVTFLPLSNVSPRPLREAEQRAARAPGAIGLAADLIRCEERFRPIIRHLLGRVVIAENLEQALRLARQFQFSLKIVTLDGELLNPGGAITGGSITRRESSYLGRSGEIQALQQTIASYKQRQQQLETSLAELAVSENAVNQTLERLAASRQEISLRQAQLTAYREQATAETARLSAALQTIAAETGQCQDEQQQLQLKLQNTDLLIERLEAANAASKQAVGSEQTELRSLQQQRDVLVAAATDQKVALGAVRQEMLSLEQAVLTRQEDRRELETSLLALAAERTEVLQVIAQAEQEFSQLTQLRQRLTETKQLADQSRVGLLEQKAGLLARLQQAEREGRELRRRVAALESRLHELQLMQTRYEMEAAGALGQLQDQYGLALAAARELQRSDPPPALLSQVKKLEQDIAALGAVNPAAIDEYGRAKDRYGFLDSQYRDLVTAKEQLATIISDIDATMSKRFLAALEAINNHFGEIFPRLFGGGKAKIELSVPCDTLGSGIEIFVQPPGKKQQNLSLLSGGERALTVIALLFSLLAYRPSPFSVVDEIDAALDEANVQRFSEFLREFSRQTQFIVVTHRKGTMEVADVMHGVTMEDSGVSRIVSVRFMEKAG
ncbi:MAG: chromosome segregation protein SMC [Sporomusaceae bacterium]|nr:chromosome segregation protein SMC [Sporomusaceae bacterium]